MEKMGNGTAKMGKEIKFKINVPMSGEERCCGDCCWFNHEDKDDYGICYLDNRFCPYCWDVSCEDYVSDRQMRHHMAVLLQANRYRRDQHVPSIYKMPDPKELGKAIDFAVEYMRVFYKI